MCHDIQDIVALAQLGDDGIQRAALFGFGRQRRNGDIFERRLGAFQFTGHIHFGEFIFFQSAWIGDGHQRFEAALRAQFNGTPVDAAQITGEVNLLPREESRFIIGGIAQCFPKQTVEFGRARPNRETDPHRRLGGLRADPRV